MNVRQLRAVTAITLLSLTGLLGLQAHWLWLGYRDARTTFEHRVDLLLARSAERIDPGDALFRLIAAVVEKSDAHPDSQIVRDALAGVRATIDKDLAEAKLDGYAALLIRGRPAAYWSDRPVPDTSRIRTARLHRLCESCDVRIGVLPQNAGPTRFLADIGGVLILSVFLIGAQTLGTVVIITTLARLRRRQDEQTRFLNTVAHEFQTPLFSISLAANVLGRSSAVSSDSELSRQVALIGRAKERLVKKTRQLLDLSARETEKLSVTKLPVAVDDMVRAAVEQTEALQEATGAELMLGLHAPAAHVLAESAQLEQALVNLLDNAFKYGGTPPQVTLRTRVDGDNVAIEVEDNGSGVEPEFRARVFDPFFRITDGARQDVQGFGLGLSQVRDVARRHAGSAAVRESRTGGSIFTLTLPLTKAAAP